MPNASVTKIFFAALAISPLFAVSDPQATTLAGTGQAGFLGDGGPATAASINNPYGLVTGPDGHSLYFSEIGNHRIRRLDLKTGILSTIAGSGEKGYSGDGGPAIKAAMNEPYELRFDKRGNLYIAEMQNHVIRRIDARTRNITTVAGTGAPGFSGDKGPATKAQLRQPHSISFDPSGTGLLICDIGNYRIRRLDLKTGIIDTWAGTGERGKPTPDGAPLAGTPLNGPRAITSSPDGMLYLALREGNAVYRIDPRQGRIFHVAGTGVTGYTGDNGPAKEARLSGPKGISWAKGNQLYIADTESHTIRKIDLNSAVITTVLGVGTQRGDGPDGDALHCKLARPHGVFVARDGKVYVADSESHRIRLLSQ